VTWEALLVVLLPLVGSGVVLKGWTWWIRHRVLRTIPADRIVRQARGVSLRVLVQGPNVLTGMNPSKANRTTGDLVLTDDRFVLTSGRGVLSDLRPERGRRFTSVRSTGPGRLVIEGDRPGPQGQPGGFRVEVMLADASDWVAALQPFVVEGAAPFAPDAFRA
jgi:hypothetical protein